jgi:hypothetical protein
MNPLQQEILVVIGMVLTACGYALGMLASDRRHRERARQESTYDDHVSIIYVKPPGEDLSIETRKYGDGRTEFVVLNEQGWSLGEYDNIQAALIRLNEVKKDRIADTIVSRKTYRIR